MIGSAAELRAVGESAWVVRVRADGLGGLAIEVECGPVVIAECGSEHRAAELVARLGLAVLLDNLT